MSQTQCKLRQRCNLSAMISFLCSKVFRLLMTLTRSISRFVPCLWQLRPHATLAKRVFVDSSTCMHFPYFSLYFPFHSKAIPKRGGGIFLFPDSFVVGKMLDHEKKISVLRYFKTHHCKPKANYLYSIVNRIKQ